MDPSIEIITEDNPTIISDRYNMPIFFIIGGVDDDYLRTLTDIDLIKQRSADNFQDKIMGVWAVQNQPEKWFSRTFSLSTFSSEKWPTLIDLADEGTKNERKPTFIEMAWICRALQRNGLNELADEVFVNLKRRIYPEKVKNKGDYLTLDQKNYKLVYFDDFLPVFLDITFGDIKNLISNKKCLPVDKNIIKNSLKLLLE